MAVFILPENFVQHSDRNQTTMNYLIQYIAGAYAWKLVHITHKYNFCIHLFLLCKGDHLAYISLNHNAENLNAMILHIGSQFFVIFLADPVYIGHGC